LDDFVKTVSGRWQEFTRESDDDKRDDKRDNNGEKLSLFVSSTYLDAIEPTHPQTILINFPPLEKVQGKRRDRNGDW
jgi:hypothetical protein